MTRFGTLACAMLIAAPALIGCSDRAGRAPTAPPEPTPAPSTAPTPEPLSASCARLGLGSAQYTCTDDAATFYAEVMGAIDTVRIEHPAYFQGDTILNLGGYYVGLIKVLDRDGLCAAFDGHELAVKRTNEFSEQYRLETSWREIRRAYMGVCSPAVFPLALPNLPPPPPGCPLPSSSEVRCDRPDPRFLGDVDAAIEQVIRQRPELFDFTRTARGSGDPAVKDFPGYYAAVIDALAAKGFCGRFDGEEIRIKRSNELSEHYDINVSDTYVRRGEGSYRSACYPAAL